MKTTVVLLVLGLCLAACGDEPAPTAGDPRITSPAAREPATDFVGTWVLDTPHQESTLVLADDGRFSLRSIGVRVDADGSWELSKWGPVLRMESELGVKFTGAQPMLLGMTDDGRLDAAVLPSCQGDFFRCISREQTLGRKP